MGDTDVKNCSSCGATMKPEAAFCSQCGTRSVENSNEKKCGSCGQPMEPDDAYCMHCGWRAGERAMPVVNTTAGGDGSVTALKILLAAMTFLLMLALGTIGYLYHGCGAKQTPSQPALSSQSKTELGEEVNKADSDRGAAVSNTLLIKTDRDAYHPGDKIRVHYYHAPGYSRDWICIVPAGASHTEAGNYQYVPGKGQGVLTFSAPKPGRYEARAYYKYESREYRITARYAFTVEK